MDWNVQQVRVAAIRGILRHGHRDEYVPEYTGRENAAGELWRRRREHARHGSHRGAAAHLRTKSLHGDCGRAHGIANGPSLGQFQVTRAAPFHYTPVPASPIVAVPGCGGGRDGQVEKLLLLVAETGAALQLHLLASGLPPCTAAHAQRQENRGNGSAQRGRATACQAHPEQPVVALGEGGRRVHARDRHAHRIPGQAGDVFRETRVLPGISVTRVVHGQVVPPVDESTRG